MKQRIAIVVLGLLLGLVAREAVKYYEHFRGQRLMAPPPAATTAPMIKTERENRT